MLFLDEVKKETRRAVFTLDNGFKFLSTLTIRNTGKPLRPEQMEEQFVKAFNEAQPNMVHKVVRCHLMRN